jgi:hypothetical protein
MKKILTSALIATISIPTFAASTTTDLRTVSVQNAETNEVFTLNTQSNRTEYRSEIVMSTCYRQEFSGYRRICDSFGDIRHIIGSANLQEKKADLGTIAGGKLGADRGGGHQGGGHQGGGHQGGGHQGGGHQGGGYQGGGHQGGGHQGGGHQGGGYQGGGYHGGGDHDGDYGYDGDHAPRVVCRDEVVYRTVAYSCMETISIPYEVFDHNSTANVKVKISAAPSSKPQTGNCGIIFNLTGDLMTAKNSCVEYLALANQTVDNLGNLKNYNYDVKLLDTQIVLAPLAGNLSDMQVNGTDLVVKTGNLIGSKNFSLKLYVQRKKLFQNDVVLIDRVLNSKEFSYEASDDRTGYVHINLAKIVSGFDSNKKNRIRLSLDVNVGAGTIIQNGAIPNLHQEAEITIY